MTKVKLCDFIIGFVSEGNMGVYSRYTLQFTARVKKMGS
jgi:hypothetical protein